jgi:uncharacterized protein YigA (DUF484 family)
MANDTFTADDVAGFLRAHPDFFESHPDVLLTLEVPHPHGGRTVSIPERQLIATREKARLIESKLAELIRFGEENDAISGKVHALTLKLIAAQSRESVIDTLYLDLLDTFQVPHVVVRLWDVVAPDVDAGGVAGSEAPEFRAVGEELRQFVDAMTAPYVGAHSVYETHLWFGEHAPHLKSFAMVVLKHPITRANFGVLLLASENAERFYAGMGTVFLSRIGDVFAASLARHLSFAADAA